MRPFLSFSCLSWRRDVSSFCIHPHLSSRRYLISLSLSPILFIYPIPFLGRPSFFAFSILFHLPFPRRFSPPSPPPPSISRRLSLSTKAETAAENEKRPKESSLCVTLGAGERRKYHRAWHLVLLLFAGVHQAGHRQPKSRASRCSCTVATNFLSSRPTRPPRVGPVYSVIRVFRVGNRGESLAHLSADNSSRRCSGAANSAHAESHERDNSERKRALHRTFSSMWLPVRENDSSLRFF